MISITSQDLQRQVGEVQAQSSREPVLVTSHGRPRCVVVSVDEFVRLKEAAGEPVPAEVKRKGLTFRSKPDPLGYDLRDMDAAIRAMTNDALSRRGQEAVESELAAVRARLRITK